MGHRYNNHSSRDYDWGIFTMKKNDFSKYIIALVVILNIIFTREVLIIFREVQNEPAVLIGCWFGFTTGELWLLSKIKRDKLKIKNKGVDE